MQPSDRAPHRGSLLPATALAASGLTLAGSLSGCATYTSLDEYRATRSAFVSAHPGTNEISASPTPPPDNKLNLAVPVAAPLELAQPSLPSSPIPTGKIIALQRRRERHS